LEPNLFKNLTLSAVKGYIDFPTIFKLIKFSPFIELYAKARLYEKGHPIYEQIKNSILTYSPNACFYVKRSLANVKGLTGCIYLDFDESIPNTIYSELPFIYASWLSFGGRGYGMLIKVDGLTLDNFTEVWLYLENYFWKNFNLTVDPQTKDISRQNVLSHDPNIYVNPNPIPLNVNTIDLHPYKTFNYEDFISVSVPNLFDLPENNSDTSSKGYQKINYRTYLDDYENQDYVIIPEGQDSRNAFMQRTVVDGDRHRSISSYAYSIVFNNKNISFSILEKVLMKANQQHCSPPLSDKEIKQTVKSILKKRFNNTLKIKTKKKFIWFNPESKKTRHDKQVVVGKEVGKLRRERTINKLIDVYKELELNFGKVTQELLQIHSEFSIRTIKKYWNEILKGAV
jgi:hypothetical protein